MKGWSRTIGDLSGEAVRRRCLLFGVSVGIYRFGEELANVRRSEAGRVVVRCSTALR